MFLETIWRSNFRLACSAFAENFVALHIALQTIMNQRRWSKALLLAALRADDVVAFGTILDQRKGWPPYSRWSDYELLLEAAKLGCKRVAWQLLERGARPFKRPRVDAPLHEAAARPGWTDLVKVLLDKGARVADLNRGGDTALHVAFARQGSAELLDLLLRAHLRDGSVDEVNEDGLSLLHIACTRPDLRIVEALLRTGQADVGVQVPVTSSSVYAGFTPLHFAAAFGQHKVVELLLEQYNADVYVQNAHGSTPLHLALERRDVEMVDLILRYENRREDRCNRSGLTHFMASCAGSDEGLVEEYLRVASFRSWSEPENLVASQVQHWRDLPTAGYTPLHFAAEFGRVETAKMLLKLGARCCATTTSEATPFALAYRRNHVDVCNLLLGCCADAHLLPPAKRRRIVVENVGDRFTDWCNSLERRDASRSGLSDSEHSTLASSSIPSFPSSCSVESLVTDPRMLCVNPRQIFGQDDSSSAWQKPKVFDSHDDDARESFSAFRDIYSTNNRGVWNFRLDEAKYCSIAVPTDIESDFHAPLDDVILDDSFETVCIRTATVYDCSVDARKALGSTFCESLSDVPDDIVADDVDEIVDEQVKFDELFEKYLRHKSAFESGEQVKFDELFGKYLRHNSASVSDDLESSFTNNADCSLDREVTEQKLKNSDSSAIVGLDDTLEVTSSSNESSVQEKTARSSNDDSSTAAVSSGYGSDSSMKEKTVSFDNQ